MNNKDKYFRTFSFPLICFLFTKEATIVNIDRTDSKRCQFVFLDSPELQSLISTFNFAPEGAPETLADIRKTIFAVKKIKDLINQVKF